MQVQVHRRNFLLKVGFLSSAVFIMSGCELFGVTTSRDTIKVVQGDLFPKAKELNIDTASYISIILHHSRISKEDKTFLKNGVKWLNEEAVTLYTKTYTKLSFDERQHVLHSIAKEKWGSSWIDNMMRYVLEAMLGDPIYGGNNSESGWKWLEFQGGIPRPKKAYL